MDHISYPGTFSTRRRLGQKARRSRLSGELRRSSRRIRPKTVLRLSGQPRQVRAQNQKSKHELSSAYILYLFERRDEAQLMKLQQLGMTTVDESKLMAMRDFISKLARNIAR